MHDVTTPTEPPPLIDIIEEAFERLSVRYGQRFAAMYEGLQQDAVVQDWRDELASVPDDGIRWALAHLPEHPPNASQFRRLCSERPVSQSVTQALPLRRKHAPVPGFVAKVAQMIHETPASDEPPRVKWARQYMQLWGNHEGPLPLIHRDNLPIAQKILATYEEQQRQARERAEREAAIAPRAPDDDETPY